mgnify:FL=1
MDYIVISPRVGTPGEPFVPGEDTNIDALLEGGFISAKTGRKSAKTEQDHNEE